MRRVRFAGHHAPKIIGACGGVAHILLAAKVSYNRGADLMVCLLAVKSGSRECSDGLPRELGIISSARCFTEEHRC